MKKRRISGRKQSTLTKMRCFAWRNRAAMFRTPRASHWESVQSKRTKKDEHHKDEEAENLLRGVKSSKNVPLCTHGVCAPRYARYRIRGMRIPLAESCQASRCKRYAYKAERYEKSNCERQYSPCFALGVGSEQEHKKREISRG